MNAAPDMSDHEDVAFDTGYSTPVPELDDHTHQSASVQKPRSRRGTADTMYSTVAPLPATIDFGTVNNRLQVTTPAQDFEEAIVDEEALSPRRHVLDNRDRHNTVTTLDPRSVSPPSSVKAFAEARRRERDLSFPDPNAAKAFADARRLEEANLCRTISGASGRSRRSRRTAGYDNDDDAKSLASSHKSAEEDVCFPLHNPSNKDSLQIDFEVLEDFIAEEETRDRTPPPNQPQPRVFRDLRPQNAGSEMVVTSDGDFIEAPSVESSSLDEKNEKHAGATHMHEDGPDKPHADINRFEYFSSLAESTIHAAEFGDLILPGEDIRRLFTFPADEEDDGVWWLNMNNPTDEEIRALCKAFGVHPLTIEDIGTQEAREKIELFPSYYFACFRSFNVKDGADGQAYEPFNIYVVVFREGTLSFSFSPNPHAANVRKRITTLKDYVSLSSDWICYALIDHIVDSFKPIIDKIEMDTDSIEDEMFISRDYDRETFLRNIGLIRKNVMGLMKLLGGKADVLRGFTKRCNANYKVTPRMDIGLYLGDIQDHVVTMMTSLTHFEKILSRSSSNYLAHLQIESIKGGNTSNKLLMKVSLVGSILIPLNVITGLFGMNVLIPFRNVNNLGPFFAILGFLLLWTVVCVLVAKRMRYI